MGDWNRTTKELLLEDLSPQMQQAVQDHQKTYNLGPILNDYTMCIETTHEKRKKGLFGGGSRRVECTIITPSWLVLLVQSENKAEATALSVPLKDALVTDYADGPGYRLIPDTGLDITGAFTGRVGMEGSQRISLFIGLGEEPAAQKFKEAVFQAFEATRK